MLIQRRSTCSPFSTLSNGLPAPPRTRQAVHRERARQPSTHVMTHNSSPTHAAIEPHITLAGVPTLHPPITLLRTTRARDTHTCHRSSGTGHLIARRALYRLRYSPSRFYRPSPVYESRKVWLQYGMPERRERERENCKKDLGEIMISCMHIPQLSHNISQQTLDRRTHPPPRAREHTPAAAAAATIGSAHTERLALHPRGRLRRWLPWLTRAQYVRAPSLESHPEASGDGEQEGGGGDVVAEVAPANTRGRGARSRREQHEQ